jgi:hypothetical protein
VDASRLSSAQGLMHGYNVQGKGESKNADEVERSTQVAPLCTHISFNSFRDPIVDSFAHPHSLHLGRRHVLFSLSFLGLNAQDNP